jgi:hypothetical protein
MNILTALALVLCTIGGSWNTLESGSQYSLEKTHIQKNTEIKAEVRFNGDFEGIRIGRGAGQTLYSNYWADVEPGKVTIYRYVGWRDSLVCVSHDLRIRKNLVVDLVYGEGLTAELKLKSGGNEVSVQIPWSGGGEPFIKNLGSKSIKAKLRFITKEFDHPIWIIGDSYICWTSKERWPYYLYSEGYRNWMADHYPGSGSEQMIICFRNDIKNGKPKYAVWAIGMNDGSDTATEPGRIWLRTVKQFIDICNKNGIIPILTTTPSVPRRDHSKKSEWVRASGLRYIDFSAAVTKNDGREWGAGLLSKDEVHPTPEGAKALAEQVLKDLPEIKN